MEMCIRGSGEKRWEGRRVYKIEKEVERKIGKRVYKIVDGR